MECVELDVSGVTALTAVDDTKLFGLVLPAADADDELPLALAVLAALLVLVLPP